MASTLRIVHSVMLARLTIYWSGITHELLIVWSWMTLILLTAVRAGLAWHLFELAH